MQGSLVRQFLPSSQFIVYVAGGLLCAAIDVGLMQGLIVYGTGPLLAASVGFIISLVVNYCFHARVTFKNVASRASFYRYLCVVFMNYLLTLAIVAASTAWLDMPMAGKIVSLPLIAINGFILGKRWIFA